MAGRVDGNTAYSRSLNGETGSNSRSNLDLIRDFYRLQILYNEILFQLKPPMILYSDGDFDDFMVSMPNILAYALSINNDSNFFYTTPTELDTNYEYDSNIVTNYRNLSNSLVNVLTQGMSEYYKIKNLEEYNTELLSYKDILEDRTKLIAYVDEIQTTSYLFSAQATYTHDLDIKLWYQVYLERHGAPGDGVFDTELLADIIEELVAAGLVSVDELIY